MEQTISRFLKHLREEEGSAENTILAYRTDIRQFGQVLSAKTGIPLSPEAIADADVARYVTWLMQHSYRPATVARKMAAVRAFLVYLRAYEGIGGQEWQAKLRSPTTSREQPRVLLREEVTSLLDAPSRLQSPRGLRDAALLALLYATGMRVSEVVALDAKDVEFERASVSRSSRLGQLLSLGLAQTSIREYIERGRPYMVKGPDEEALFLNQRGGRLSRQGIWLVVKRWAFEAGLGEDVSPHSLRHSLAHHLLKEGKSRREVQKILGLSSPSAVRINPP